MLFERMDELEQLIRSSQSNHTVKLIQSYKSSVSFLPGERPFPYKGTTVPRQETRISNRGNDEVKVACDVYWF